MKRNALARKILCGLLAAGVVGTCGNALAATTYGVKYDNGIVEDNSIDGKISGYTYGIYAKNGTLDFKFNDINISGEQYGVYASTNGIVNVGDSSNTENVVINVNRETNGPAYGIYSYKSNTINLLGKSITININNTVAGADSIRNSSGIVNIGDSDTDVVSITAQGSSTNAVYNQDMTNIKGKNISIESLASNGASYGINTYKNAKTSIGTDNTKEISVKVEGNYVSVSNYTHGINTGFNGETTLQAETVKIDLEGQGGSLAGIETSGNTTISADNVELNVSGKTNATGVYSSGSKGNALIQANDKLTIDVTGKAGSATAIQSSVGKVNLTADKLNVSAQGNKAYTIDALNKADIEIGKGASELNLTAKGTEEAYVVNAVAKKGKVAGTVKLGENAGKINLVSESTGIAHAVSMNDGTNLTIGGEGSEVSIKTTADKQAIGIFASQKSPKDKEDMKLTSGGSVVNINGNSLVIEATSANGEAHGIHVQNNSTNATSDFATVNVNTAKTVINAKTGIAAYSQGVVNMNNGDVEINAEKVIETRGNAVTNINQDGTHTVKLNGDIVFDVTNDGNSGLTADATVNVNLSNAESSLTGSVKTAQSGTDSDKIDMDVKGMKLNISNNAAWNMTGDSFVNSANVSNGGSINVQEGVGNFNAGDLKLDNANLNLQGNEQKVTVKNLAGDNGIVTTNSLGNKVTVDANNAQNLTVNGTKEVTDAIASGSGNLQGLADVVKGNDDKSIADTVTSDANDIIGGYSADVKDGKVVTQSVKTIENTTNRAISDMASISLMTWRQENNDMNKRLGELRDSKGEHGAWARMARGESKYGAQNVKNQYNYYQVGYDEKLSVNPNWTVGVALTRTEGNSTFATGSGENKHTGVAIYGSYLADNGSFLDLIAKYARMDNDYKTIGAGVGDADYETNGYSISAEYGKRFTKANGFWIEPQVELTYGKVGSASYTTSKGALVNQDGIDSLVGRLGFSLGKDIKQGNVYLRASYLYDFDGETTAYMSKAGKGLAKFEQDIGGGWWEVGVGTNINLSDATHLYFDVEKTYGGNVATPWQWNAGVRWSF